MFKRNWTTWLKFVNYSNYSTLSSQHNWDDLYDQLMRIFTLILKGIKVLKGSETYEINGYGHNVDLLIISHSLRVSWP